MKKLSKKTLDFFREEREKRLEKNVIEYPDEFEIYNEVLEQLIFELDQIQWNWWLYDIENIKEWIEDKIEDVDCFDRVLEWVWK